MIRFKQTKAASIQFRHLLQNISESEDVGWAAPMTFPIRLVSAVSLYIWCPSAEVSAIHFRETIRIETTFENMAPNKNNKKQELDNEYTQLLHKDSAVIDW